MQFSKLHNIENGYIFNLVYIPVATIAVTLACYLCGKLILRGNKHIRKLLLGSR